MTISGGKADGIAATQQCGGGLYVQAGSPTVRNCLLRDNVAGQYGGGAYYANSTGVRMTHCRFVGNRALVFPSYYYDPAGGGLYCTGTELLLTNCTFSANLTEYRGNAMNVEGGQAVVVNCTFVGNPTSDSSAAINAPASTTIINCIIWGNPVPFSPCVNAGSNAAVPADLTQDLAGKARVLGVNLYEIRRLYLSIG